MIKVLRFVILFLSVILFFGCSVKGLKREKNDIKSKIFHRADIFLKDQNISPLDVNKTEFNKKFFYPWSIEKINLSIKKASWANGYFSKRVYFAENMLPWGKNEIKRIVESTNFDDFNGVGRYAITIKNTQVRNLPTFKPFMRDPKKAGEGFAFDYLQNTRLHINTPLFISHYNKDGSWAFVQNPSTTGWIRSDSFAVLDRHEREAFERCRKIVIVKDNIPVYDKDQNFVHYVKLGAVFPAIYETDDFYRSYIYDKKGEKIDIWIPKNFALPFPAEFNKENILKVSNELLKEKYGWGGFMKNRDCSAMVQDYFRVFGIFLPRNSAAQSRSGKAISLKNLDNDKKREKIKKYGFAFKSLLYLPGHIMIYVGSAKGKIYAMHNMWGIRVKNGDKIGRYIIGRAVISDLTLGETLPESIKKSLLINRVKSLINF